MTTEKFRLQDVREIVTDMQQDGFRVIMLQTDVNEVAIINKRHVTFKIKESVKFTDRVNVKLIPYGHPDNCFIELEWTREDLVDNIAGRL